MNKHWLHVSFDIQICQQRNKRRHCFNSQLGSGWHISWHISQKNNKIIGYKKKNNRAARAEHVRMQVWHAYLRYSTTTTTWNHQISVFHENLSILTNVYLSFSIFSSGTARTECIFRILFPHCKMWTRWTNHLRRRFHPRHCRRSLSLN